jgi:hypothetical protein
VPAGWGAVRRGGAAKFDTDYHFYHYFGASYNRVSQYHDQGCVRRLRRQAGAGPKCAPGDGRAACAVVVVVSLMLTEKEERENVQNETWPGSKEAFLE